METTNKTRTRSRCREWERQRRNKFNDAISKLGEVVNAINKSNDDTVKGTENTHFPKIEVIQKAILCLTNFIQEKTQLKAEILALEVKLQSENNLKSNKKDASTQVFIGINKKSRNSKYVKVMMLQKSKQKKASTPKVPLRETTQNTPMRKLPTLLPSLNINNKKGPENTIVVLPAAPYLLPQRPILFPNPPTIVLVEPNIQHFNKPSVPILNRNNGDITKTTMVNILPISAYSHPLSAVKIKNNSKNKNIVSTRNNKKAKPTMKSNDKNVKKTQSEKVVGDITNDKIKEITTDTKNVSPKDKEMDKVAPTEPTIEIKKIASDDKPITTKSNDITIPEIIKDTDSKNDKQKEEPAVTDKLTTSIIQPVPEKPPNITNSNTKPNNTPTTADKNKESKLPNILDATLCENVVDVGNARLELAEEFLAASPTAAFLMSFPLVSGNRADSPAEEPHAIPQNTTKSNDNIQRNDITVPPFEKPSAINHPSDKIKLSNKLHTQTTTSSKQNVQPKYTDSNIARKLTEVKTSNPVTTTNVSIENPFLNLSMPSLISTSCTLTDSSFGLDFDCNINKSIPSSSTAYVSSNNIFYKSDPFSTVKNTIYSTSSISSGHEFNSLSLYPCAMDKYTSKNKTDFSNVEDNLMKIGSSRLTYDIDLGWSHKSFDFVNCTTSANTFNKDILTSTSNTYATSYNPFNPEFHASLVSNANKKDTISAKPTTSFPESITSFYSQSNNLWTEDMPFYSNNVSKTINKSQNYLSLEQPQMNSNLKSNITKQFEPKPTIEPVMDATNKSLNIGVAPQVTDKYTKKSPKTHINWMTSEIRPIQNNCNPIQTNLKGNHKPTYVPLEHPPKRQDHNSSNYFPISMPNFPTQSTQEDFQVWPSSRPAGTTEISIEPPPINLPTLVGDLALGPHDKKKTSDALNRVPQKDIQNCNNFLSVTQLMNRSTDNMLPNYQGTEQLKSKSNISQTVHDVNRKAVTSRFESHIPQPCYMFNDSKFMNSYEHVNQFPQMKSKTNKNDKSSKMQKNNYSAEALIRGGSCTQKTADDTAKFMMPSQKYSDFNSNQDVAQVSHFPPIIDYTDNTYAGQQFSGTTLYNSSTNAIPNSFYTNFMPGTSNLMSSNYANGTFTGDFIDYNQTADCNYGNHKYEDLKIRNNPSIFQHDKLPSNYKSSRRESGSKHKLECSKKESTKKYQSKRAKPNNDTEEWTDAAHILWQNKTPSKRHSNFTTEEIPFANYVGNQMTAQYQSEYFNSHLMSSNVGQTVGHNVDRTLSSFPVTSRANFNLSTIFPEITMKVQ